MACLRFKEIQTYAGRLSKTILTGGTSERTLQIFDCPNNRIARIVRAHNLGLDLWYTIESAGAPTAGTPNAIGNFDDAWAADAGYGYSGRGLDLSGTWLEGGDKIWVHDTFDHEGATLAPTHHPAGYLICLEIFDVVNSGCPI